MILPTLLLSCKFQFGCCWVRRSFLTWKKHLKKWNRIGFVKVPWGANGRLTTKPSSMKRILLSLTSLLQNYSSYQVIQRQKSPDYQVTNLRRSTFFTSRSVPHICHRSLFLISLQKFQQRNFCFHLYLQTKLFLVTLSATSLLLKRSWIDDKASCDGLFSASCTCHWTKCLSSVLFQTGSKRV